MNKNNLPPGREYPGLSEIARIQRSDFDEFIDRYKPGRQQKRKET